MGPEYSEKKTTTGITAEPCGVPCPIERGMRILGRKWKASILWHLKDEPVRFNELTRQLDGASKKMINQRLTEMERQGLVIRTVLKEKPIAVSYRISAEGRSALHILEALKEWALDKAL